MGRIGEFKIDISIKINSAWLIGIYLLGYVELRNWFQSWIELVDVFCLQYSTVP